MCTLTYIKEYGGGRIITANRDESPLRNASRLSEYQNAKGEKFFIAKEPLKGGTNVAISTGKRMSVLLNGAFEQHEMGGKYVKSRGILLLESLEYENLFEFAEQNSLSGIEPFTLVEFQNLIREVRWDGTKLFKKNVNPNKAQIWASAQLYSREVIRKRELWFKDLLAKNPDKDDILEFHFKGGDGDTENDLVMNRSNLVRTVSITQLADIGGKGSLRHFDLVGKKKQVIGVVA